MVKNVIGLESRKTLFGFIYNIIIITALNIGTLSGTENGPYIKNSHLLQMKHSKKSVLFCHFSLHLIRLGIKYLAVEYKMSAYGCTPSNVDSFLSLPKKTSLMLS